MFSGLICFRTLTISQTHEVGGVIVFLLEESEERVCEDIHALGAIISLQRQVFYKYFERQVIDIFFLLEKEKL